jgi:plastocyanin
VDSHDDSLPLASETTMAAGRDPLPVRRRIGPRHIDFQEVAQLMRSIRGHSILLVALFGLALALIGAACSNSNGSGASRGPNSVAIVDNDFSPSNITVKAGTTVDWTNTGSAQHTVTADDGSYDSSFLSSGAKFTHTFATAGTFTYHCNVHSSMHGTVTVTP